MLKFLYNTFLLLVPSLELAYYYRRMVTVKPCQILELEYDCLGQEQAWLLVSFEATHLRATEVEHSLPWQIGIIKSN